MIDTWVASRIHDPRAALAAPAPRGFGSGLHIAARLGAHRTLGVRMRAVSDPLPRDDQGWTPLHAASSCGRLACARLALRSPADLAERDGAGRTPLHLAAGAEVPDVLAFLLEQGAEAGAKDRFGYLPLPVAVRQDRPACVRALLASTPTDARDGKDWTALHHAAAYRRAGCLTLLLQHGASVAARTAAGELPLDLAVRCRDIDSAKALVAAGADLEAKASNGRSISDGMRALVQSDFADLLRGAASAT